MNSTTAAPALWTQDIPQADGVPQDVPHASYDITDPTATKLYQRR